MGKYPHIPVIKPEYHSIMLHSTADIFRLYFQNIFHRGPVSKPHSPMLNSKATEMSKFPCCHTQRDRHWLDFRGMSLKCISPEREMALTLSFISFFALRRYQQSEEKPVNQEQYTYWITTPQVDFSSLQS